MRKLKLQVQMTVNGYIAGPNGEMDWMEWNWDDQLKEYVTQLTQSMDCIVLGRKLAEGFIPYWKSVAENKEDPQHAAGKIFTHTQKVVFSKTVEKNEWNNTSIATEDLIKEITDLKKQNGKDIIAYGGASFVSSLIKHKLIDEFHLFINPASIPKGLSIFNETEGKQDLKLIKASSFECGIVVLHYELKTK